MLLTSALKFIYQSNLSSQCNRLQLFDVPDSVRWSDFLDALDGFWKKSCGDGSGSQREGFGLDEDAKRFLTLKLLGSSSPELVRECFPPRHYALGLFVFFRSRRSKRDCSTASNQPRQPPQSGVHILDVAVQDLGVGIEPICEEILECSVSIERDEFPLEPFFK